MSSESEPPEFSKNLIPEAKDFVQETSKRSEEDSGFGSTSYGHTAATMAQALEYEAALNGSPEQQRKLLRKLAQRSIDKFGPEIIPFLRDELRLAIEETDTPPAPPIK